ncbi:MAG: hypothetical protein CL862_13660 [Cyanobium sp. NAT70]|nr:hypothetical protein [Cyanobium sp. NAT70]
MALVSLLFQGLHSKCQRFRNLWVLKTHLVEAIATQGGSIVALHGWFEPQHLILLSLHRWPDQSDRNLSKNPICIHSTT